MAITFDGADRLILLDGATTQSIRGISSRWVDWVAADVANRPWPFAFRTIGDPPTVPVYAYLLNNWKIKPLAGSYTLTLDDGFLRVDGGGDPFVASGGVEPRIIYRDPVIAVGYAIGGATSDVNVVSMNGAVVVGTGVTGDPFRGEGEPA